MARDHNHNLVRTGTSRPADEIEYADFVDMDEQSGTASHNGERRSAQSRRDSADRVRKSNRWILIVTGLLGFILTVPLVLAPVPTDESTSPSVAATGSPPPPMIFPDEHGAVLKPMKTTASDDAGAAPPSRKDLIDECYHLDGCRVSKVLNTRVLQEGPGWRLIKAALQYGTVKDPSSSNRDDAAIDWDTDRPTTMAALCSPTLPTLAWPNGLGYVAEEFDFGGNGVPGAQQNNANIYQALCHGFYANELATRASALGYSPLPDGGRGEYKVESLGELVANQ